MLVKFQLNTRHRVSRESAKNATLGEASKMKVIFFEKVVFLLVCCLERREEPTTAGAVATTARRAHPPSLTATSFHKISFYSAKKAISQPKQIYSTNGNPSKPMIFNFSVYINMKH